MSDTRRYPLSEWGANRLRRRGVMPSTAAWHVAAWSTALLLSVYGLGPTLVAMTEAFLDLAAGYGSEPATAICSTPDCSTLAEPGNMVVAAVGPRFLMFAVVPLGILMLSGLLRWAGVRQDQHAERGWRTAGVSLLVSVLACMALAATAVWLAQTTLRSDGQSPVHGSPSLVESASLWWPLMICATAGATAALATLHQRAALQDFRVRWRMTERERRDELRDSQMNPEIRRAISNQR
jgi:hypothetical protein